MNFEKVSEAVQKLTESDDICLMRLHDEQLVNFKHELDDICKSVLSSDEAEDKELSCQQIEFQKLFDCSLAVKRLLENRARPTAPTSSHEGVKLRVPSFDGNILNWKTFWDQFCLSVHDRSNLSDSQKLVYLLQSLKDGPAK